MSNKDSSSRVIRSILLNLRLVINQDSVAKQLCLFPRLEQIDFANATGLTSLGFLQDLNTITSFKVFNTPVRDEDLGYFGHLPLETLECAVCPITQISALAKLPLKHLRLIQCVRLTETALDILEKMPLQSLSLSGCEVTQLPQLNAQSLLSLDLSHMAFLNPSCMQTIAKLSSLMELNLTNCSWIDNLSGLETMVSLTRLDISLTRVRSQHLEQLPSQLVYLQLQQCRRLFDISALKRLEKLEYVNLSGNWQIKNIKSIQRPLLKIDQDGELRDDPYFPTEEGSEHFEEPPSLRRATSQLQILPQRARRKLFA